MQPRNALIVGGQRKLWTPLFEYLAKCNVQIFSVWHEEKALRKSISGHIDIVIIVSTLVSHALQKHAQKEAKDMGIPVIYTSHHQSEFAEKLKKWGYEPVAQPEAFVEEVYADNEPEQTEPEFPIEQFQPAKAEQPLPKEVAPPQASSHQDRESIVKELLKTDPAMQGGDVIRAVNEKIGISVSKPFVDKIRWDEHGLREQGGRFFNKAGQRVVEVEKPQTTPITRSVSMASDCAIIGCKSPRKSKGFCINHYQKMRNLEKTGRLPDEWVDAKPQSVKDILLPRGRAAHGTKTVTTEAKAAKVATVKSPAKVAASLGGIAETLAHLRSQMKEEGISDVFIPLEGSVRMHKLQETSIEI
jgi:hypothetical protein